MILVLYNFFLNFLTLVFYNFQFEESEDEKEFFFFVDFRDSRTYEHDSVVWIKIDEQIKI